MKEPRLQEGPQARAEEQEERHGTWADAVAAHIAGPYPWYAVDEDEVRIDVTDERGRWSGLWWLAAVQRTDEGTRLVIAQMWPTLPTESVRCIGIRSDSAEQAMLFIEEEYDMVVGRPGHAGHEETGQEAHEDWSAR